MKEIHQFETLEPGETIYLIVEDAGFKLKEIELNPRHFDTERQQPFHTEYRRIGEVNKTYYLPFDKKYFQSDGPNTVKVVNHLKQSVNTSENFTPDVIFLNKELAQEYLKNLIDQKAYEYYTNDYINRIHVAFLQNIQTGEISNFVSERNDIKELINNYQQTLDYQKTLDQRQLISERFHAFTKSGKDLGFKPFNPDEYTL